MNEKHYAVALDGPSGAGKSTLARAAAKELGILYVDTGAIYRAVGLAAKRAGVDAKDAAAVEALLPTLDIRMEHGGGEQKMYLADEDVSREIREPEISMYASAVSALPTVRRFLLDMQRRFAREGSVIMDGRDIGTVVLPEAEVKIFLTAAAETRAKRRWLELRERGSQKPCEEVLAELRERDYNDTHRDAAPLRQAEDAVLLDTSELDFAQSLKALVGIVREKVGL